MAQNLLRVVVGRRRSEPRVINGGARLAAAPRERGERACRSSGRGRWGVVGAGFVIVCLNLSSEGADKIDAKGAGGPV